MANSVDILINAKDNASKSIEKMQSRMDKFRNSAKLAGAALTGVGVVGVAAFKSMTEAAIEQQQAEGALAAAVENTGVSFDSVKDKVNAVTAAIQRKTNFGDEEQLAALTQMTAITGDVEKAMAALPAVIGAAAVKGKGLKMIAGTLTRALDGQVDTAITLGMEFDKTASFQERLNQVMGAVGGIAEAQANPLTQLKNDVGDVAQQFGAVLLPILTPVIDTLREFARTIQKLDPNVTKFLVLITAGAVAFAAIAGPILLLIGFLPTLAVGFGIVTTAVAALGGVFTVLVGATGIGLVVAAIVGLGLAWKNNWGGIQEKTKAILGFLFKIYKSKLGWILPGGALIKGLMFIKDNWVMIWDGLRRFTSSILSGIADGFRSFINRAIGYLNGLIKAFNLINPFADIPTLEEIGAGISGALGGAAGKAIDHAKYFAGLGTEGKDYSGSGAQDDSALPDVGVIAQNNMDDKRYQITAHLNVDQTDLMTATGHAMDQQKEVLQ
jgi:hypothetical protein